MHPDIKKLNTQAQAFAQEFGEVKQEMQKIIVGQEQTLQLLLTALLAEGHVLLEGVPGLAKTLMVKTLAGTLQGRFQRIQFTPDLLPADLIGTKIYHAKSGEFITKKGPLFANFILADEINRAPPKVQSALLESMQEKQITIGEETFFLEPPFLVLATQNPIETEGTYRLPEAQVDRFMFKVLITYPSKEESQKIIKRMTSGELPEIRKIIAPSQVLKAQAFCRSIYCDERVEEYVTNLVEATRDPKSFKLPFENWIEYGVSPRALIWLIMGAKASALLEGRGYVVPEDVQTVAYEVLRHRLLLTYEAEAEGITADEVIKQILSTVKVP